MEQMSLFPNPLGNLQYEKLIRYIEKILKDLHPTFVWNYCKSRCNYDGYTPKRNTLFVRIYCNSQGQANSRLHRMICEHNLRDQFEKGMSNIMITSLADNSVVLEFYDIDRFVMNFI